MPLRLLVFDLDGTLIDSEQDLANAVNATLAHLHRPPLPIAVIRGYIGDGASALLRRALTVGKRADTLSELDHARALDFFLTHYRAHKLDNTRLYPGVLDTLNALRAALPDARMAVLTNKPVRPSREICAGLGLAHLFFQIYGGESFPTKKPDPLGLNTLIHEASAHLKAAGQPALTPDQTIMIGDSPVDIATAHAAGTLSIGCTFGLNDPAAVRAAHPTHLAAHPADWLDILRPVHAK